MFRRIFRCKPLMDMLSILFGSLVVAVGLVVFTIPNNIAPGGISGLATSIGRLTSLPIGALSLALNAPILILAWRIFGIRPLFKTLCATILLSVYVDLLEPVIYMYIGNTLLAAVMGGVCIGAGLGVMFVRDITTGGTDLISLILRKYFPHVSMSKILMMLDVAVVLIAVLIFNDIEIALYSGVTIFCVSKVIDAIMQGVDFAKIIFVVTTKHDEIGRMFITKLDRGVTQMDAIGCYTGEKKNVLLIAIKRNEIPSALKLIKAIDPLSFTIICSATEVHGQGFNTK